MASRALWSGDELAVLDEHIDKPDWLSRVRAEISGRSIKSLKVRMAKRRSELGLGDGRRVDLNDDDWMPDAAEASRVLAERINFLGLRP